MFHNPEDVRWFKVIWSIIFKVSFWKFGFHLFLTSMSLRCLQPTEVWSKCGRRGRIREPVGTHGKYNSLSLNGWRIEHILLSLVNMWLANTKLLRCFVDPVALFFLVQGRWSAFLTVSFSSTTRCAWVCSSALIPSGLNDGFPYSPDQIECRRLCFGKAMDPVGWVRVFPSRAAKILGCIFSVCENDPSMLITRGF